MRSGWAPEAGSGRSGSSRSWAALRRFDAQPQAERLGNQAEARAAGVSVFGEGSGEGFAFEAGGCGSCEQAAP